MFLHLYMFCTWVRSPFLAITHFSFEGSSVKSLFCVGILRGVDELPSWLWFWG